MKLTITTIAAMMIGTTAFAGIFDLPQHQPNGYRDTGCDPAFQRQITNAEGKYLYSNNPTCPRVKGPSDDLSPAAAAVEEPEEDDDGDEGEGDEKPETPVEPKA